MTKCSILQVEFSALRMGGIFFIMNRREFLKGSACFIADFYLPKPIREIGGVKLETKIVNGAVYKGPSINKVALTIDDGYGLNSLITILDFSEKNNIPLTFFIVGKLLADKRYEEQLKRAIKLGCSLQNHSWSHPYFTKLADDEIKTEVEKASEQIEKLSGGKNGSGKFLRPPYGSFNEKVVETANKLGMKVVIWSLSSGSTGNNDVSQIVIALSNVGKGDIILFHVNGKDAQALPAFFPLLAAKGLSATGLSDLVG